MKFSDYLDSVKNTDEEQKVKDKINEVKNEIAQAANIPVAGKYIRALLAFGESESAEKFEQTEDYEVIKDWNFSIHGDINGDFGFSLNPSKEAMRKVAIVVGIILGGIVLFMVYRALRRRKIKAC